MHILMHISFAVIQKNLVRGLYSKSETGCQKHWFDAPIYAAESEAQTHTQAVFMPTYCRSGLASAQGKQTDARVIASQLVMGLIDA